MKLSEQAQAILRQSKTDDNKLYLPGTLDRKMYLEIDAALKAAGGKWNTKAKVHLFDGPAGVAVIDMLSTGEYLNAQKDLEFYETPDEVADYLVRLADIEGHGPLQILEPSAGKGALIRAIRRAKFGNQHTISACEINPQCIPALRELGVFAWIDSWQNVTPTVMYDRVIMNPPFSKNQDIDHVMRAWQFLKPGGILVAIMSTHMMFSETKKNVEFREFLNKHSTIMNPTWFVLPEGSFKSSGTMANTCIIKVQKPV